MQHEDAISSHTNVSQLGLTTLGSLPITKNTYSNKHTKKESSTPLQHNNRNDKSIVTQEDHIWLQYNVTHKGQKVQLVKAAHAHTQEMMEMMHCSSEHYTKLYIIALSSLVEEYAE